AARSAPGVAGARDRPAGEGRRVFFVGRLSLRLSSRIARFTSSRPPAKTPPRPGQKRWWDMRRTGLIALTVAGLAGAAGCRSACGEHEGLFHRMARDRDEN